MCRKSLRRNVEVQIVAGQTRDAETIDMPTSATTTGPDATTHLAAVMPMDKTKTTAAIAGIMIPDEVAAHDLPATGEAAARTLIGGVARALMGGHDQKSSWTFLADMVQMSLMSR